MSNALATTSDDYAALVERVLVNGDLSKLTPAERMGYYKQVCESTGLNPLTKPFEYITLNGKMVLYALRGATDQLRSIHKVSVVETTETERDGVLVVTTKVQNAEGRTDIARGAVYIEGLKGEHLANAILKAETKAKRRATLSICGLGLLDETEVETIPGAVKDEGNSKPAPSAPALSPPSPPSPPKAKTAEVSQYYLPMVTDKDKPMYVQWGGELIKYIMAAPNEKQVQAIEAANLDTLALCKDAAPKAYGSIQKAIDARLKELQVEPPINNTLGEWLAELDSCTSEAAVDDLRERALPNIFPADRTDFKAKCQAKSISLF